ncbi:CBS domain-containing membrane protein [Paracoccus halophilus]|uniref:CBS-domain-containing membrane protein n=1 Tax=Paracoccus halophilus TaxID=376733 RepID=A0A099F9E7_9RHOB|nr:HPP family protein [Paracoccus halophilus]KGJ06841.1 CBS-domain-containing membrane protein [Paracoccus halophilus]SFA41197.1 CBS domain-containing membrane protein [Paracoccus halophilus]
MTQPTRSRLQRIGQALGPAIVAGPPAEALRAGIGALAGLAVTGLFVLAPLADGMLELYLIAPFGATSVLVFAVPNSPLAQPWSAVIGNGTGAVIGVLACMLVPDPIWRVALAVGLTVVAMIPLRAVHPPAGAVAMTAALNPEAIADLGFGFVLTPVLAGTLTLVAMAMLHARATGRRYPFRQFDEPGPHGTADPAPIKRLGLSRAELSAILQRYRQSLNLGVEDLARLIGAAELQAATHRSGPLTAADIMSRDLVSVGPETRLRKVAELFRQHDFTSLPVVEDGDRFRGIIFQIHLIRRAHEDAFRHDRRLIAALARLLDRRQELPTRAAEIMLTDPPHAAPGTPLGALLPLLASGGCDAVPVLDGGRILGIVTQTDLIAALARENLRHGPPAR